MKVTFESEGNFDNMLRFLTNAARRSPTNTAQKMGAKGVELLSQNTPVGDTGETARGWDFIVDAKMGTTELAFVNKAHPEATVNVAKLIETGHGTGNGGYVPPRPYIRQALEPLFNTALDTFVEEMMD